MSGSRDEDEPVSIIVDSGTSKHVVADKFLFLSINDITEVEVELSD